MLAQTTEWFSDSKTAVDGALKQFELTSFKLYDPSDDALIEEEILRAKKLVGIVLATRLICERASELTSMESRAAAVDELLSSVKGHIELPEETVERLNSFMTMKLNPPVPVVEVEKVGEVTEVGE